MSFQPYLFASLLVGLLAVAGCDQVANRLGLEDPGLKEAKADAEGKAVGAACRQSGRAIEDCYSIYGWLPKASVFAGWRDMNDYMQSNKLEIVEPKLPPPGGPGSQRRKKIVEEATAATDDKKPAEAAAASDGKSTSKSETKKEAEKGSTKPAAKP